MAEVHGSRPPWVGAAAALVAVGWGANQFASLLLSYRLHQHLSTAGTDALFGVYAVGLVPALLLGGPLSDRVGRRLVVPVFGVSGVATVVLMTGGALGLPALYAGRFLGGIVSGLAFAPGTAWVKELSAPPWGDRLDPQTGARRAAVALSAGFGLGPLVAGLLAQWAPDPAVVPYVAHLVVLVVAAPAVLRTPETVTPPVATRRGGATRRAGRAGRRLRPVGVVPPSPEPDSRNERPRFAAVVAPMAPWVFGAAAISFTVLPAQVTRHTHGFGVAFAAVVAGLTLAVGVGVQPAARRLDRRRDGLGSEVGLLAVVIGLLLGAGAARTAQPALVLAAAVALGSGYGSCLVAGLLEVQRIADPHRLAGLTARYYALTYVGFAAPLALAALAGIESYATLLVGAAVLAALTLVLVRLAARRLRPGPPVAGGG